MKRYIVALLAISSIALSPATLRAEEAAAAPVSDVPETAAPALETATPAPERGPEIGTMLWLTKGHGEWEIKFGALFLSGKSKLEWEDIDAPVVVVYGEAPITESIRIGGSIGYGELVDGQNTDGDWLGDFQFSESQSDTDGDVTLGDINVYYQVLQDTVQSQSFVLDVFAGYQEYQDDLNDTDGVQTIENERKVNQPFPGLDSTYKFDWQVLRLGARGELQFDPAFTLRGSVAYLYLLNYEGKAFWNLREDFRRESPNFVHDADSGSGVEIKCSVRLKLTENLYVEGGYWLFSMSAEDGTDTIYFADGTEGKSDLSEVNSLRHGVFGGITCGF